MSKKKKNKTVNFSRIKWNAKWNIFYKIQKRTRNSFPIVTQIKISVACKGASPYCDEVVE